MKKYRCVKILYLFEYDDDGFLTENIVEVDEGEVFQLSLDIHKIIGGEETIHLENENKWIEITFETLNEYFVEEST